MVYGTQVLEFDTQAGKTYRVNQDLKIGLKLLLFVLPPSSLKLNGHVERANRTHREEFYEIEEIDISLVEHNRQLESWECVYNFIRPHQSLDYSTSNEYYQFW